MHMVKTNILVSGIHLGLLKDTGKDPCDVSRTGVGRIQSSVIAASNDIYGTIAPCYMGICSLHEVAGSWLQSHAANVLGESFPNSFPFSPTVICPF